MDGNEITVEYDWNQEGGNLFLITYNSSGVSIGQTPLLDDTFAPVTNLISANNGGKNVVYEMAAQPGARSVNRIVLDY